MGKNKKKIMKTIVYHVGIILLCFAMLYPVLWMIFSSFEVSTDIVANQEMLLPNTWTIQNYINGWEGIAGNNFGVFMRNSFFVTVVATLGCVLSSSFAAYAFARLHFPLKKLWFALMMLTMMLPIQVLMVPQYILMNQLGWIGSYKAIIVPFIGGNAFYIYLIIQFVKGVPKSLDEAALIDGCSWYGIFFRIMLPLMKPAVTTAAIFAFYWKWEDFMGPLLYITRPAQYLVPQALKLFADPSQLRDFGALFAMSTLSLVPVFIIFFLFQKNIVEGVSMSGLKD